ncbi:MAG TPA: hypothetical protein VMT82_11105 [candidate division Zixibacteria bacterium]|nr:hypothetical protein [candidate division Zixibacteria bacterium]
MAEPISAERWSGEVRGPAAGPRPEPVGIPTALPPAFGAEERDRRQLEWEQRGEQLGRLVAEYRRQAWRLIAATRLRVREMGDLYPLQTIAAVAGAAFLLGVILRVGRNRG